MASPRIQVVIDATAEGLRKGVAQARGALDGLDDKLASVGKTKPFAQLEGAASKLAQQHLGPLGDAASALGVDVAGMSTGMLAGGAAIAGLGAAALDGVHRVSTMVDEVRKFHDVSGATWEESSRLVEVMGDLGVSSDTGAAAMSRLGKAVEGGKLRQYGIDVAYAKDGSVDMVGTLGNVADALNSQEDPAKRAAMGSALLGKSWYDLMPVLSQGRDGLSKMTDEVRKAKIVTPELAAAQMQYKLAVDDLGDALHELQMVAGKELIPTLGAMASQFTDLANNVNDVANTPIGQAILDYLKRPLDMVVNAAQGANGVLEIMHGNFKQGWELIKGSGNATSKHAEETKKLADELENEASSANMAKDAIARMVGEQKKAIDAANELRRVSEKAAGAVTDYADVTLALRNSEADLGRTQDDATEKIKAQADAIKKYGKDSNEAKAATKDADQAVRDYQQSALSYVKTAEAQSDTLAELNGHQRTAEEKADGFNRALKNVRDTTNDPVLRAGIDELIKQTKGAADTADAAARKYYEAMLNARLFGQTAQSIADVGPYGVDAMIGSGSESKPARASGGPVFAGQSYMVGEMGPELFVPQRGGTIIPNGALGGQTVHINVNSPIGRPDDVVRWISEELRRLDRSKR